MVNELSSEDFVFRDECCSGNISGVRGKRAREWQILIVDDNQDMLHVTQLVLQNFSYKGKSLELIQAGSGMEAQEKLKENPNIALVLLDIVMEESDSGFRVVEYLREVLNNHLTRVILRTGQPGILSRNDVITNCGINDYLPKEELTSQKLKRAVVSALRSYYYAKPSS